MTSFPLYNQPYKVAKEDRIFKGIVACGLDEFIKKSLKSLGLSSEKLAFDNVVVSLDEDGTIIDDKDYFSSLKENTKFIIRVKDSSSEIEMSASKQDESQYTDCVDGPSSQSIIRAVKKKLSSNNYAEFILAFVTMSNEELEYLINCDLNLLICELEVDQNMARLYTDNATKELIRREELLDAAKLIQLYQLAKENASLSGNLNKKRQRSDF